MRRYGKTGGNGARFDVGERGDGGGDKKGKCSFLCDSFRQSFLRAVNMPDSKC